MRKLLGFQFADKKGNNIAGDDNDPTGHPSYEIIPLEKLKGFAETFPGFLFCPIYDGDIEDPTFS